jgi:mono/diheme cytochrome c family protein
MRKILTLVTLFALSAGCNSDKRPSEVVAQEQTTPAEPTPQANVAAEALSPAAARKLFKQRCSACHGESGHGDGPGSAALTPKPRNFSDSAWQTSVTDEQIAKTIALGGAAVGKSPAMPGHPDLEQKPESLNALVKVVRTFRSAQP